ncbi:MAG: hypothetical protein KJ893_04820 [Candidatus Omnitrophica bacterium]|nr:hypothetical protein [Candidatus Omnitrophota bacterium]MBU4478700.1 hypothetical protein [Candidatus Omnitrophota bacterium]MCG2703167.1 hypothetical protein [Candidatus Omnitrophota bacterium]
MYKTTKALHHIEEKMSEAQEGSLRHAVLACAKSFKSSWIDLGQYLVTIHKDKEYKVWGYSTFEVYCAKEIGIRKETAAKLIRSYRFLEEEEPEYVKKDYLESADTQKVPSCEAVNMLRQVKQNKDIGIADYERMKRQVLEEGKGEKEVKDVYRSMLQAVRESDPEEARREKKLNYLRRMISTVRSIKRELEINKLLPAKVITSLEKVIADIEQELS